MQESMLSGLELYWKLRDSPFKEEAPQHSIKDANPELVCRWLTQLRSNNFCFSHLRKDEFFRLLRDRPLVYDAWKDKNLLTGPLARTISEYNIKWNELCKEPIFKPNLEDEKTMVKLMRKNFSVISGEGANGAAERFRSRFDQSIKDWWFAYRRVSSEDRLKPEHIMDANNACHRVPYFIDAVLRVIKEHYKAKAEVALIDGDVT